MSSGDLVWDYTLRGIFVVGAIGVIVGLLMYLSDSCERAGGHMSYLNVYGKTLCVDRDGHVVVP